MRQIESRDCKGFAFHRIPRQQDRPGTERASCPEMSGFVRPRDFRTRAVPKIFVPLPTVP